MNGTQIRWVALATAVVVIALGVVLALNVGAAGPSTDSGRFVGSGRRAPAFTVQTLDGSTLSSADLAGRTIVVNFWNTWCIPCLEEAPALAEFYDRHRDDGDFAMVGIVRDDSERSVRDYVVREGVEWVIGFDPRSKAALAFGTTGQPETFVIAPDGRVAGEQFGAATVADLELMLRAARGL